MRYAKLSLAFLLFVGIAWMGVDLIRRARTLQSTKVEYTELNHFRYGLFSVDEWKKQLSTIVADEINGLSFKGDTRDTLKKHLEAQLAILIDKIAVKIKKENYKTTKGWLRQSLMESFVNVKEIKEGIPEYSEAMMKEIASRKTEKEIKGLLKENVDKYMSETFDKVDTRTRDKVIEKFGHGDIDQAKLMIEKKLHRGEDRGREKAFIMIGLAVALFLLLGISKKPLTPPEYFILTLSLLMLMLTGIMTPMIDMEARISELSFVLFDHEINFHDQVLFFQSKSILDVFHLMITHKELQMKLVGVLLVTFSVLFPLLKMFSTLFYYYDYCSARSKKLVKFFVEKSGKWSMADVLVVAIFMAYIGFNGIINSQLNNIKEAGAGVDVLTTNGTHLQPGYYIFLSYAVLAMFLSNFLKNRPYECRTKTVEA